MSTSSEQFYEMRRRVREADRVRRWREAHEHIPDVRRCDRVIVEALAYLVSTGDLDPAKSGLVREILRLATDGLEFQEYPRDHALSAVTKRFRYHVTGGNGSGSVRSGVKRREAAQAERTAKLMAF